jgi:hypothetical protein
MDGNAPHSQRPADMMMYARPSSPVDFMASMLPPISARVNPMKRLYKPSVQPQSARDAQAPRYPNPPRESQYLVKWQRNIAAGRAFPLHTDHLPPRVGSTDVVRVHVVGAVRDGHDVLMTTQGWEVAKAPRSRPQKLQPEVMPSGRLKWRRQAKLDLGRSTKIEPQDHYVAAGKVCTPYTYTLAYMPAPVIEWYHMPRCADERGEGWIRPARRLEPRGFQ